MAGIFAALFERMHEHPGYAVCSMVIRAKALKVIECFHLLINLRPYPLDACFGKSDEVEPCEQQAGEITLRIIAVVSDYLGSVYAKCRQLFDCIGNGDHIRQVSRLLCKSNRLPAPDRVQCKQFNRLQTVAGLIEAVPCFYLIFRIDRYG